MAHAFQTIPASPTFGTIRENLCQSDYINRLKAKYTYCNTPSYLKQSFIGPNYQTINSFNLGKYVLSLETSNTLPVNKSNLIIGQYSSMNLNNTCEAINQPPPNNLDNCTVGNNFESCTKCDIPITMNVNSSTGLWNSGNTNFYQDVYIDPIGELFGSSQCGELNYTKFMVFNPPTEPEGITLGFS
jgi:hypothetical protein